MKNIIFNSSMPRACSTLLQNIFNQRPDMYATPTDGVIELLCGARERFTNSVEFKASEDQDQMLNAWRNFANKGLQGYAEILSDKPNIVLKGRGYKSITPWLKNIVDGKLKVVCMVRNLKGIVASLEKLHRKNPDKVSQWYIENENRGTTVDKRVDMYLQNPPLAFSLDQIKELHQIGNNEDVIFVRAEDLSSNPHGIMNELYTVLELQPFNHDFNNIQQTTHENDVMHGLDNDLHTIRNQVKPLVDDYESILGKDICDFIDKEYKWYQDLFFYSN